MSVNREAKPLSLVDGLTASFNRALRTAEGEAEPVALLWTDPDGQWRGLIPSLRAALPELYTLGLYDPTARIGPAIWLKCIVDRTILAQALPSDKTPILYLPDINRQMLRAAGDCPPALQP